MTPRRYELSDFEWSIIEPLLPNKPCGVPRSDDRRLLAEGRRRTFLLAGVGGGCSPGACGRRWGFLTQWAGTDADWVGGLMFGTSNCVLSRRDRCAL